MIPGTELSVDYNHHEIHLVGLFIDIHNQKLIKQTTDFVNKRKQRNLDMIKNFQKAGIPMTAEELSGGNPNAVITRAHFARYLIEHGVAKIRKKHFLNIWARILLFMSSGHVQPLLMAFI